jgi:hypothetical protein
MGDYLALLTPEKLKASRIAATTRLRTSISSLTVGTPLSASTSKVSIRATNSSGVMTPTTPLAPGADGGTEVESHGQDPLFHIVSVSAWRAASIISNLHRARSLRRSRKSSGFTGYPASRRTSRSRVAADIPLLAADRDCGHRGFRRGTCSPSADHCHAADSLLGGGVCRDAHWPPSQQAAGSAEQHRAMACRLRS